MPDETALMADFEQRQKETRKRGFELRLEAFMREYGPSDRYERAEFERHLISLVMQIYEDAQRPVLDQLGKIASFSSLSAMLPPQPRDPAR